MVNAATVFEKKLRESDSRTYRRAYSRVYSLAYWRAYWRAYRWASDVARMATAEVDNG